jgi:hypothetical protein
MPPVVMNASSGKPELLIIIHLKIPFFGFMLSAGSIQRSAKTF